MKELATDTIDPRYLVTPMWELQLAMGNKWIKKQEELFKQILEEECTV